MLTGSPPEEPASPKRNSAKTGWLRVAVVAWMLAAAAYAALRLNFERAPVVHVRWSAAVDGRTRAELEKQLALADGTYDSGQTWAYVLTSPSPAEVADRTARALRLYRRQGNVVEAPRARSLLGEMVGTRV